MPPGILLFVVLCRKAFFEEYRKEMYFNELLAKARADLFKEGKRTEASSWKDVQAAIGNKSWLDTVVPEAHRCATLLQLAQRVGFFLDGLAFAK